jgi:lanosterol synthase
MTANVDGSMISYPNYKFIFPIKALGMYAERFGDKALF